jgi:hypothetical protein
MQKKPNRKLNEDGKNNSVIRRKEIKSGMNNGRRNTS